MSPSSFARRLKSAQAGPDLVRFQFVAAYSDDVRAEAKGKLRGPAQGKVGESDLVQVSLVAAANKLADFVGTTEDAFVSWLRRIVERNAIDLTKTHLRRDEQALERAGLGERGPLAPGGTPSSIARHGEDETRLREAVTQLPDDWRIVIELRSLEGLPFAEVAKKMGRKPEAARKLWGRAIQRLGELLGPEA